MWTLHLLNKKKISVDSGVTSNEGEQTRKQEQDTNVISVSNDNQQAVSSEMEIPVRNIHTEQEEQEKTNGIADTTIHHSAGVEGEEERIGIWGFTRSEIERFPALRKRNFWCIQRHSATAMHYDLRMQVDDGTVSWAVPKGLIGISKKGESSRLAVETTIHPISYTTYEGSDGRKFSGGRKGGTLLWDIGEYTITRPSSSIDSTSDEERPTKRRKRRSAHVDQNPAEEGSDDVDGKYQEDLFRQALYRRVGYGRSQSIHFILHSGRKMTNHHFILILAASSRHTFSASGQIKKTWFLKLPKEIDEYPWDKGGEEGDFWGRSVKTSRALKEVTEGHKKRPERWEKEEERFKDWFGNED
ncbi:DNA ligase D, 3'-phosphoesterase domain-containing protein [Kwoniella dendrophila CBS 6074]|uniref:DNA ligase D, 3'-phosphoesterase domain-containing protein n=1 Tax=Kwoniella dendrophila CBS 6074 TaxID=1295534 RepID=A0AAX4JTG0_9TREE